MYSVNNELSARVHGYSTISLTEQLVVNSEHDMRLRKLTFRETFIKISKFECEHAPFTDK